MKIGWFGAIFLAVVAIGAVGKGMRAQQYAEQQAYISDRSDSRVAQAVVANNSDGSQRSRETELLESIREKFQSDHGRDQQRSIESEGSPPSSAPQAELEQIFNQRKSYLSTRRALMIRGWLPFRTVFLKGGQPAPCWSTMASDVSCAFEEVNDCSGTGQGFCSLWFRKEDKYLSVTTADGHLPAVIVVGWKVADESPQRRVLERERFK